jgi:hypothetical protein
MKQASRRRNEYEVVSTSAVVQVSSCALQGRWNQVRRTNCSVLYLWTTHRTVAEYCCVPATQALVVTEARPLSATNTSTVCSLDLPPLLCRRGRTQRDPRSRDPIGGGQ